MVKSTKTQRLREKMLASLKESKQKTLDNLPVVPQEENAKTVKSAQKKQIVITEIDTVTKEDELHLKVGFKLIPSKADFSKLISDLFFDEQKLPNSAIITIPESPLAKDDFELTPVINMKEINAGHHTIRVEMYDLWNSQEKLSFSSKEVSVEYVPQTKESRLIKIPFVKHFGGVDLDVVSVADKNIYRDIEETTKKESVSKREEW
ncbi:MAG: hypothetical protein ABSF44_07215 [Candidatus Bathyarchaeia archaeon]